MLKSSAPTFEAGSLPAGLHLGSFWSLYGTPIEPGHFTIELEVVDSCAAANTVRGSFTIDIAIPGSRARGITNGFFFGAAACQRFAVVSRIE